MGLYGISLVKDNEYLQYDRTQYFVVVKKGNVSTYETADQLGLSGDTKSVSVIKSTGKRVAGITSEIELELTKTDGRVVSIFFQKK